MSMTLNRLACAVIDPATLRFLNTNVQLPPDARLISVEAETRVSLEGGYSIHKTGKLFLTFRSESFAPVGEGDIMPQLFLDETP